MHRDMTDELDLRSIANEFIALSENRKHVFSFFKDQLSS